MLQVFIHRIWNFNFKLQTDCFFVPHRSDVSQTPITQHPAPNIQHPTSSTQHPAPNTHHPTPNTQHPTPNTQHPAPNTQHPAPITQHPTSSTQHQTPNTKHPLKPFQNLQHIIYLFFGVVMRKRKANTCSI